MRIDKYYHRIENYFGELRLVVTGYNKRIDDYFDYIRKSENGTTECRNLYLSCYGGYSLLFPGQKCRTYYGAVDDNDRYIAEEWGACNCSYFGFEDHATDHTADVNQILKKYPAFVYTLKKWKGERYYITSSVLDYLSALQIWKEHPETEFLLANGLDNLVFSKSFWRLTEKKRREVVMFCINTKGVKKLRLCEVLNIMKYKMTLKEYKRYQEFKSSLYTNSVSVQAFRYLTKKNLTSREDYSLYMDYRKLAKQAGHDLKENYWACPSDLVKAHAKVLAESNAIAELRKTAKGVMQIEMDFPGLVHKLEIVSRKLASFNSVISDYEIIVTGDLNEWQRQADTLHQCIIRCEYWKKVARRQEMLVFVRRGGFPVATAEILSGNKIGQFYADERSGTPGGSRPTAEVVEIFNKWLSDKPDLIEFSKTKKKSKKEELAEVV